MSWYSDGEKPTKGDLIRSGDWDEEIETNHETVDEENPTESCQDCIHYAVCLEWQDIEDKARKQSHTTEEDFLRMEHHKDCGHFDKGVKE